MSFQAAFWIFAILASALLAVRIAPALRTGVWKQGKRLYRRDEEPAEYWFSVGWCSATIPLLLYMGFIASADPLLDIPFAELFIAPAAIFWLVRSLQTRVAGLGELELSRHEDTRLYWAFVGLNLLVASYCIWRLGAAAI